MALKQLIREKALELGFVDIGISGVEPLDYYIREIESRPPEMYGWVQTEQFNTVRGASPGKKHDWARSLVVLINNYHRRAFPPEMVGILGRSWGRRTRTVTLTLSSPFRNPLMK